MQAAMAPVNNSAESIMGTNHAVYTTLPQSLITHAQTQSVDGCLI
jgi:hypothetical protein